MTCLLDWLTKYEAVAVWLEGIALVFLLGVELYNGHKDRTETVEQLKLAQDQIRISQNAERAWIMTELTWQDVKDPFHGEERNRLKLCSTNEDQSMNVMLRLRCRNSGRSPAWIDRMVGYSEIVDRPRNVSDPAGHDAQNLGTVEPLAPDVSRFKNITLECPGQLTDRNFMSVYVQVEYRDIFNKPRLTSAGYIVSMSHVSIDLRRQDEVPHRNANT